MPSAAFTTQNLSWFKGGTCRVRNELQQLNSVFFFLLYFLPKKKCYFFKGGKNFRNIENFLMYSGLILFNWNGYSAKILLLVIFAEHETHQEVEFVKAYQFFGLLTAVFTSFIPTYKHKMVYNNVSRHQFLLQVILFSVRYSK